MTMMGQWKNMIYPGDLVQHFSMMALGLVVRVKKVPHQGFIYHVMWCTDEILSKNIVEHWEEEVVLVSPGRINNENR